MGFTYFSLCVCRLVDEALSGERGSLIYGVKAAREATGCNPFEAARFAMERKAALNR